MRWILVACLVVVYCASGFAASAPVGMWNLDDGAGTTAADSSGNGNLGTLVNGPTWTTGKISGALSFNGTSSLQVANAPILEVGANGADFSVGYWINLQQGATGLWRSIAHKGNSDNDRTFAMWMHPTDNGIHYRIGTTNDFNEGGDSAGQIPVNAWTHIAYVKSANVLKLYINGVQDSQVTLVGASVSNNGPIYFGKDPWFGGITGKLDEILLYNRALSGSEVAALANVGTNHAPVVTTAATATPNPAVTGQTVTLSVAASDVDGDPLSYAWQFGDGSTGSGASTTHAYSVTGLSTATVTVSDGHGGTVSSSVGVTVTAVGTASATFTNADATTQGSWKGVYGSDGYNIVADTVNYPAYAQVSTSGTLQYTWAASSSDVRALQKATSADRIAACWHTSSSFDIDVNLTDGQSHQVALYLLDWDPAGRFETVEIRDAVTGALLDSRSPTTFVNGLYLVWSLKGHLTIRMLYTGCTYNSVLSGLFFGGAGSGPIAPPIASWTLDDGAGTTAIDASGNGNPGTLVNGPTWTSGRVGGALGFDGAASLQVNSAPLLEVGANGNDLSVGYWLYLQQGGTGQWRTIMRKSTTDHDRTFGMWLYPDDNRVYFAISTTASWNEGGTSNTPIPLNTWTHIAYVKSSSALSLYINGALDSQVNLTGMSVSNTGSVLVGRDPWYTGLVGKLDEILLFNRALGASEVAALASTGDTVSDTVWVEDSVPTGGVEGSSGGDAWSWVSGGYSGSLCQQSSIGAGAHQHYFTNATATLAVNAGESLCTYVYLDPANLPTEVMLQWYDGSWEHRAYWGANAVPWGADGTTARCYIGALPAAGTWARLEVPASAVGVEGSTLSGMAFTLNDGRAWFDRAGKKAGGSTAAAPVITAQPVNMTVTAPASGSFSVAASGSPTPTYQWQSAPSGSSAFTAISGATSTSYTTGATSTAMSGMQYRCVASNSAGSATSSVATLTVNSGSTSGVQEGGFETPYAGAAGSFYSFITPTTGSAWTFTASGISANGSGYTSGNPNAQEGVQAAFLPSTGSISQSVTLAAGSYKLTFLAAQRGNYNAGGQTLRVQIDGQGVGDFTPAGSTYETETTAIFTVSAGSHTIAILGLNPLGGDNTAFIDQVAAVSVTTVAPAITTQPINQTVTAPGVATFSVAASGSPTPTLQWQSAPSGSSTYTAISGAISTSYTTGATSTAMSGMQYRCVATNSAGSATSSVATLTVNAAAVAPSITTQPVNQTVTASAAATFSVAASGSPAPTYQWQSAPSGSSSFTAISGATSTSYNTGATTTAMSGRQYRCVVTNSAGSATSSVATLTVNAASTTPVGMWNLDDGAGTTAADASGDGNPGTLMNGPVWALGIIGGALNFDGVNDYVSVADSASTSPTGSMTVAAWINPDVVTGTHVIISKIGADNEAYYLAVVDGRLAFYVTDTGNGSSGYGYVVSNNTVVTASSWQHVAVVFDASLRTVTFFVNGAEVAATLASSSSGIPGSIFDSSEDTKIGIFESVSGSQAVGAGWDGLLDEVKLYERALTATEVLDFQDHLPPLTFTTPTTIGVGNTTYEYRSIIVSGTTLTVDGFHRFSNLTVQNSGIVTHPGCTTATVSSLDLRISGALSVDASSKIDVTGRGYLPGRTVGNTPCGNASGSYGGLGSPQSGDVYGDFRDPQFPGGGGHPATGAAGGGLIRLNVGALTGAGSILSNGTVGTYSSSGGGIRLDVGVYSFTGLVTANGVADTTPSGGGRIAVYYQNGTVNFAQIRAYGGTYGTETAGNGTVYVCQGSAPGMLQMANGVNRSAKVTPIYFGDRVSTADDPASFPMTLRCLSKSNVTFEYSPTVITLVGASLLDDAYVVGEHFGGESLALTNGSLLCHNPTTLTRESRLEVQLSGALSIDSTSRIDVTRLGYLPGRTVGNTPCGNASGSYGGLGSPQSGDVYGDFRDPQFPGGGGHPASGAAGGGLVRLNVGALTGAGSILSDGTVGTYSSSGGGIRLDVGTYSFTGLVTANGVASTAPSGGGRIALYYQSGTVNLAQIRAYGGTFGSESAGHGTVYVCQGSAPGMLLMANGVNRSAKVTPIYFGDRANTTDDPTSFSMTLRGAGKANVVIDATPTFITILNATLDDTYLTADHLSGGTVTMNLGSLLTVNQYDGVNLTLNGNSKLRHFACTATQEFHLDLQLTGALSIDALSSIDVTGLGYLPGRTVGNAGGGTTSGSHGGYAYGEVYGDFFDPQYPGGGSNTAGGASGGGVFRAIVGTLTGSGNILANGTAISNAYAGSGGSIRIDADTYSFTGAVAADGACGSASTYPSGGGRVAIYYQHGTVPLASVTAYGGRNGTTVAGHGTVFVQGLNDIFGVLKLDNNGLTAPRQTPIWYGPRYPTAPQPKAPYDFSFLLGGGANYVIEGDPTVFDYDSDYLMGWEEAALGTSPRDYDTNHDGISDSMSANMGIDPLNPDTDGDGVSNIDERRQGTDVLRVDTDGDGVSDALDAYPCDPTRSVRPSVGGDVTAPNITIVAPQGLIPLN